MANGHDRNLVRLLLAVEGFRARYRRWPTRVRLDQGYIEDLQRILSDVGFENLTSKLVLVPDPEPGLHAEDDEGGRFSYGGGAGGGGHQDGKSDIPVQSWLVGLEQRPYRSSGLFD